MGHKDNRVRYRLMTVAALTGAEYNPRRMPPEAAARLRRSLDRWGCVQPVVWNVRTGRVVGGHQRLKALRDAGVEKTTVAVVDLPEDEERALNIALNNAALTGEWDLDALQALLPDLPPDLLQGALDADSDVGLSQLVEELDMPDVLAGVVADPVTKSLPEMAQAAGLCPSGKGAPASAFAWQRVPRWFDADGIGQDPWVGIPAASQEIIRDAKNLVILFSGGKDSTATLYRVARMKQPGQTLTLVYSDTGVELPGTTRHVLIVAERCKAVDHVECVVPPEGFWSIFGRKRRWPSIIFRDCIPLLIHEPMARFITGAYDPANTIVFHGRRAEESVRGSKLHMESPLPEYKGFKAIAPLYAVKREACEQLLVRARQELNIPTWPGYALGFRRTACYCCPGQCRQQARALVRWYPGLARDILQAEVEGWGDMQETNGKGFTDIVCRPGERLVCDEAGVRIIKE